MVQEILSYLKNLPGWRTKRKLLIIESDDWGSTRMPSLAVRKQLEDAGINLGASNFMKYDTLAGGKDFDLLYEVLSGVKDSKGNPAVLSPFVNTTNADFGKIIASGYQEYFYEPFTETLKNYHSENVFASWREGITHNLFAPQYHGREHFNVPLLMRFLREGNKNLLEAFKHGVIHIPIPELKKKGITSLAPAFYYENPEALKYLQNSVVEGAEIFTDIFGFPAPAFIPPNAIFNEALEEALVNTEIKAIVVDRKRNEPDGAGGMKQKSYMFKFGKYNPQQKMYYLRNMKFEPVQASYNRGEVLAEIKAAFQVGKPAIISSHRINYVGGLDTKHRDYALKELDSLLHEVIKKWPEVEFISSGELVRIMSESKNT